MNGSHLAYGLSSKTRCVEENIQGKGTRGRRRKQLLDDWGKEKIL